MSTPLRLPSRPADGHKGTFGRVLIVAGSSGMSGAACLSATAALRSGAGLVTVAVPQSIQSIVASFEPSYMTVGLTCDGNGRLSEAAVDQTIACLSGIDAVAVGPGLGQGAVAGQLVQALLSAVSVPLILDADALNLVAAHKKSLRRSAPTIVTPHPGEFARLTGELIADMAQHRTRLAREFAVRRSVVVVLKGAGTVISDGRETYVNESGNSGMATGGSGDVLTGVIAALCAQGMAAFDAAVAGVHAHGLAGDLGASAGSERGLIASDLLHWLPRVWAELEPPAGL